MSWPKNIRNFNEKRFEYLRWSSKLLFQSEGISLAALANTLSIPIKSYMKSTKIVQHTPYVVEPKSLEIEDNFFLPIPKQLFYAP